MCSPGWMYALHQPASMSIAPGTGSESYAARAQTGYHGWRSPAYASAPLGGTLGDCYSHMRPPKSCLAPGVEKRRDVCYHGWMSLCGTGSEAGVKRRPPLGGSWTGERSAAADQGTDVAAAGAGAASQTGWQAHRGWAPAHNTCRM